MKIRSANLRWLVDLFKAISIQSMGNGFAQMMYFVSLPLIARLYGPSEFAPYGTVLALSGVLYLTFSLGMDLALLTARRVSARLLMTMLSLSAALSAVFAVLICWIVFDYTGWMLVFAGTLVWGTNWGLALGQWAILHERHSRVACLRVVQAVCFSLIAIGLGTAWPATQSLLIAASLATVPVVALLFDRGQLLRLSTLRCGYALRRYWSFFWPSWPGRFVDLLGTRGPAISAVPLFGSAQAGLFLMTMRLLELPSRLLSGAVGSVLLMRLAKHDGARLTLVLVIMAVLAVVSLVGFGLLYLVLPWAVPLVLGEQWIGVLPLAKMLVFVLAVQFVVSPLSTIMLLNSHQNRAFKWQLGYVCTIFLTLAFAYVQGLDIESYVVWFCGATVAAYVVYVGLIVHSCWSYDRRQGF